MEMECELLISSFKDPKTIALVKEDIGRISDGSSSHCAGALKLGLKKGFELKKQQRGVLLRCPRVGCTETLHPPHTRPLGQTPTARIAGITTATTICSVLVVRTPEPALTHRARVVERSSCRWMYFT